MTCDASSAHYQLIDYKNWRIGWLTDWSNNLKTVPDFSSLWYSIPAYLNNIAPKKVIRQTDYSDLDYTDAYSRFYCKTFQPRSSTCTRYIFFTEEFDTIDALDREDVANSFCGFITVWPTEPEVIGSSVLPFPIFKDGGTETVSSEYEIHVAGRDLKTSKRSAMFASKDHGVAVCASVTTWLATNLMHRKYGLETCSSTETTLLATGVDPKWGRPFPQAGGLDNTQIVKALHSLGYAPVPYCYDNQSGGPWERNKKGERILDWIGPLYAYVSSGIPVIMICTLRDGINHALLAVGLHTRARAKDPKKEDRLGQSFTKLVDKVIVHDDRGGPYSLLEPQTDSMDWTLQPSFNDKRTPQTASVSTLIVPLPQSVILTSRYAHALGIQVLRGPINSKYPSYEGPFRTILMQSIRFKKETIKWTDLGDVPDNFRGIAMPRWIWVTEAYQPGTSSPDKGVPFARAILDASQLRFDKKRILIAYHINKIFKSGSELVNNFSATPSSSTEVPSGASELR